METIHGQLKRAGVPLEHHGYHLQALVTPKSRAIIQKSGIAARVNVFYNKDDHQPWFNIPYAYTPAEDQEKVPGPPVKAENKLQDTPVKAENKTRESEVQKALQEEIRRAAQELIEEQKKAIQLTFEEHKAIIWEIVEEEKRAVKAHTEALGQSVVELGP